MNWVIVSVFALLIPISAIVLNSDLGKALAKWILDRANRRPSLGDADSGALLQRIEHLEREVAEVKEQNAFLRQLHDGSTSD